MNIEADDSALIRLMEDLWNPEIELILVDDVDYSIKLESEDILYRISMLKNFGWDNPGNWLKVNKKIYGAFHLAHLDYFRYYIGDTSLTSVNLDLIRVTEAMQESEVLLRKYWDEVKDYAAAK